MKDTWILTLVNFWIKKGQRIATGQANVKSYNRQLCTLISVGKAKPSLIISHELPLDEAPGSIQTFRRTG